MLQPDHMAEARRWAKFPATVLLCTGVLWLLLKVFEFNIVAFKEQCETVIGVLSAVVDIMVLTLGCMVVGICVLFLQRWALWAAYILPALALLYTSADKAQTISRKFAEANTQNNFSSFGGGVMNSLLLLALWAVYLLVIFYIRKAFQHLDAGRGRGWSALGPAGAVPALSGGAAGTGTPGSEDEFCLLLPETPEDAGD
jgi:hypothetical protein